MTGVSYFISDLHLDPGRPWVIDALECFLSDHHSASSLYILGDLFEFWVGDDENSELADRVAQLLRHFTSAGPALYLMHGNRDFLIGERFATRVGATLLNDPTVVTLHDQRILLMHGDSLCTRDEEYQAFRKLARSTDWQNGVLNQPLEVRRRLAQQLREASKEAGSRKAQDIMDVTEREVIATMAAHECTTLIHGHTHRPARHENSAGTRWVLGDWDKSGWFLRSEEGEIELIEFDINQ